MGVKEKMNSYQERDSYIYIHRRVKDGLVFYVGKGTVRSKRDRSKDRSKAWKSFIGEDDYEIERIVEGLTQQEAIEKEIEFLENPPPNWKLVNVQKASRFKSIDPIIRDVIEYDETSPSFLRWKRDIGFKIKSGAVVGWEDNNGYYSLEYNGVTYLAHRVVYFLFTDQPSFGVLNHIDCNRKNNNISNLEVVTYRENNNRAARHVHGVPNSNNTSGVNGVTYNKGRYERFMVEWYEPCGRKRGKSFSFLKYGGKDNALNAAKEFNERIRCAIKHNS